MITGVVSLETTDIKYRVEIILVRELEFVRLRSYGLADTIRTYKAWSHLFTGVAKSKVLYLDYNKVPSLEFYRLIYFRVAFIYSFYLPFLESLNLATNIC